MTDQVSRGVFSKTTALKRLFFSYIFYYFFLTVLPGTLFGAVFLAQMSMILDRFLRDLKKKKKPVREVLKQCTELLRENVVSDNVLNLLCSKKPSSHAQSS